MIFSKDCSTHVLRLYPGSLFCFPFGPCCHFCLLVCYGCGIHLLRSIQLRPGIPLDLGNRLGMCLFLLCLVHGMCLFFVLRDIHVVLFGILRVGLLVDFDPPLQRPGPAGLRTSLLFPLPFVLVGRSVPGSGFPRFVSPTILDVCDGMPALD